MPYYLRHYFNPDFDHQRAKPGGGLGQDEGADVYSLGYAQNVIAGQILAEIMPADKAPGDADKRWFQAGDTLPAGANTFIDPKYPQYLVAGSKGYVFYNDGKITVKKLLNVRQDVSFRTGNIFFVGDICVHGSVRSGFSVQGDNVRIMGMVEGGIARARRDLMVEGGCRGGSSKHCLLDAGGKLLTPFVEKAEARAHQNMAIEKYCLYSTVYAGANMVVRGQMYGSTVNCLGSVYVGAQLGNRAGIPTRIYLGYDPYLIRQLEKIDSIAKELDEAITHLRAVAGHLPPDANETTRKLARLSRQHEKVLKHKSDIWNRVNVDDSTLENCKVMAPGRVYPGVEIGIGRAFMQVERQYENSMFRLCYDEIVVEPMPARKKTA
ncbi:MAG: DUF342 domain-containing protein [Desulfovibrio sp.]|nr:DUF342 domain-containing protein [Desulfovibrio sp.]